ncbi:MAG TPA: GNAT family N-acetyltransferase [Allosphingosinicella sp.]|jgi:predicted N-acetyltransferase YhbS
MPDAYRFALAQFDCADLERISALLRAVFPRARHLSTDYLRWKYIDNPDGEAIACNAFLGAELVGHMAAVPMRARIEGKDQAALFFENGAVAPLHRRRRLQSRISAAMFDEAVRQNYAAAVGTGNKYSTGPLLTRFAMVRPLEARVGFGIPVRRAAPPAPSFERVWSEEALRWRLCNPERRYFVRNGQVLAASGAPGIAAVLLDESGIADQGGAAPGPLRAWIGLDPGIDWRRSRYVPIPKLLRRSPLNLVFRDMTGGGTVPDPDRFVFRAIDFDPW